MRRGPLFNQFSMKRTTRTQCPQCGKENRGIRLHCQFCHSLLEPPPPPETPPPPEPRPPEQPRPQCWEYLIIEVLGSEGWKPSGETRFRQTGASDVLNTLGSQGWELTGTISTLAGGWLYLKRPTSEPKAQADA